MENMLDKLENMQNRSLIMQSTNLPRRWSRTTKQSAIYLASTCEFCGILSHVAERDAWK